jgi:hypothetical protein
MRPFLRLKNEQKSALSTQTAGHPHSWDSICNIMSTQQRITITLPTDNHKTIHLRATTQAEAR